MFFMITSTQTILWCYELEHNVELCVSTVSTEDKTFWNGCDSLIIFSLLAVYFKYGNGSVYEDKKLNLLMVMKLLNEALRALRDENCRSELNELHAIERMVACYKKVQETLNTMR